MKDSIKAKLVACAAIVGAAQWCNVQCENVKADLTQHREDTRDDVEKVDFIFIDPSLDLPKIGEEVLFDEDATDEMIRQEINRMLQEANQPI